MGGREGSQRDFDAEDRGLPSEQANVSRDVNYTVDTINPPRLFFLQDPVWAPDGASFLRLIRHRLPYPALVFIQLVVVEYGHLAPDSLPVYVGIHETRHWLPNEEGSACGWKCSMHLSASGRTIGATRSGLGTRWTAERVVDV